MTLQNFIDSSESIISDIKNQTREIGTLRVSESNLKKTVEDLTNRVSILSKEISYQKVSTIEDESKILSLTEQINLLTSKLISAQNSLVENIPNESNYRNKAIQYKNAYDEFRPADIVIAPYGQVQSFAQCMKILKPGQKVFVEPGVYREIVTIPVGGTSYEDRIIFTSNLNTVAITGLDNYTGLWELHSGNIFKTKWIYDFFIADGKTRFKDQAGDGFKGYAELVLLENKPATQVGSIKEMSPGTFYIQYGKNSNHIMYVWTPSGITPNKVHNRLGVRSRCLSPAKPNPDNLSGGLIPFITLENLQFKGASNFFQTANAMVTASSNWIVKNCIFENANGCGLGAMGKDITVINPISRDNGQIGFNISNANKVRVSGGITCRNNWKKVKIGFEAGGGKIARSKDVTLDGYTAFNNFGAGIWFDIANENSTIINCTSYGNLNAVKDKEQGHGIFYELSHGPALIENNTCYDNEGSDILLSESTNITVRKNTIINGKITFRDVIRELDGKPISIQNVSITENKLVNSIITPMSGIWDKQSGKNKNVTIDQNIYSSKKDAVIFQWGGKKYTSLDTVRTELGFEINGSHFRVL